MTVHGDCLDVFKDVHGLASIIADPPGGAEFMSVKFDRDHGGRDQWIKYMAPRFRVAREATESGSWGLFWSFGRTAHWTACALDDAGWEITNQILHLQGQGWPKGKSQLKPAKEIWWLCRWGGVTPLQIDSCRVRRSGAERPDSRFRSGYSAKPEAGGPGIVAEPAGSWPPDALISHCLACLQDGVRQVISNSQVPGQTGSPPSQVFLAAQHGSLNASHSAGYGAHGKETVPMWKCLAQCFCGLASLAPAGGAPTPCPGCGDERHWLCPVAILDEQSGRLSSGSNTRRRATGTGYVPRVFDAQSRPAGTPEIFYGDSGGASRFFPTFLYDAKAAKKERQAGCEHPLWVRDETAAIGWRQASSEDYSAAEEKERATGNVHATIKPVGVADDDGLMRWLVRLITPKGGKVGDPFLGSGSTALAADIEGHPFVGCDIDPGAVEIAKARRQYWIEQRPSERRKRNVR